MKGSMSTDLGIITVNPEVIAKYAGSVAVECFGIVGIVAYGVNILSVSDNLMSNVKYKVEEFTGMAVEKINIFVEGVRVID